MQTLLVFSGTLITLFMLKRILSYFGLRLPALNPLAKRRQRHHQADINTDAIFLLEKPLEIAALFLYAVAKADGTLSITQKNFMLELFETGFQMNADSARSLLANTAFIFSDGEAFAANPKRVLEKSYSEFSSMQIAALEEMLESVANCDGPATDNQQALCDFIVSVLPSKNATSW